MKEHWFRFIERKEREAQYYQTLTLSIAGDVSNIKDGFKKLREAQDEYHGALFPWMPNPAVKRRLEYDKIVKQMEEEIDYLAKNHTFELKEVGGILSMAIPDYLMTPRQDATEPR